MMIEFEVRGRDLLARIGRFKTKSGTVETPLFLPVINPAKETVRPKEIWETFKCRMLITNAYIIKRQFSEAAERGVHSLLDYPGVVMTDSGAYQILAYGKVETTPEEIVRYQEEIDTDIATILDVPTGWKASKGHAQHTVDETLRRARQLEGLRTRDDIAWVGPVQGGRYLDLVAKSAQEMSKLPFEVHALGSPTPVMEQYYFDLLVDMILTAKMNLPHERLFHLFGAGHPFMFALAVALGCDLFDSAAYSIFAREERYMTERGTIHLERLEYLPCSCPVCSKRNPRDLMDLPEKERERELCMHNLHICFSEMRRIKQAIVEGRLWEHLEMRARGHPSLLQALKHLGKYGDYLERHSPVTKRSGLFFFDSLSLARPEVIRHRRRLLERYAPPRDAGVLLLLPYPRGRFKRYKKVVTDLCDRLGLEASGVHVCIYAPPFGVIPIDLKDVYPLSQYEYAYPPDHEVIEYIAEQIRGYAEKMEYKKIVMLMEAGTWEEKVAESCRRLLRGREVNLEALSMSDLK